MLAAPQQLPFPFPGGPGALLGLPSGSQSQGLVATGEAEVIAAGGPGSADVDVEISTTRVALKFIFSQEGVWFREFLMDELVKSVDALSRDQAAQVVR